ncbi:MAG: HAD family phosphatase [Kiritimatiellae bacterium]|nr:HAD family phosphatase [Kiritimatiellia bacterium]
MNLSQLLPAMEAALFDLDGTLLDTMQPWRQCNTDYLESQGIELSPDQRLRIVCASSGSILIDYVRATFGHEIDLPAFRELQKRRMMEVYLAGAPVKPGVFEFLSALRARGTKIVLSTATWATHATIGISRSGLAPYFDAICCCDAIDASKSSPAYFDRVSALIGVPKARCVLFDDAIYALKSARAASLLGAVAVADPTNVIFRDEISQCADALVDSFDGLAALL